MKLRDLLEMSLSKPKGIDALKAYINQYLDDAFNHEDPDESIHLLSQGIMSMRVGRATEKIFEDLGWTLLGYGVDGQVFGNPRYPFIVKLFSDASYMKWVEFCRSHRGNPYVPVFRGKPTKFHEQFYVVRVERLLELSHDDEARAHEIMDGVRENSVDKYIQPIHRFFTSMTSNAADIGYDVDDLRIGNLMKRSNGQIVIIDPVFGPTE